MKIFIFENVMELTSRYHSEGGLVVIAKDKFEVNELIKDEPYIKLTEEDWATVKIYSLEEPDVEPEVFIFPDAGCC